MTPPAIVAAATKAGLDVIAISDHNTAGNVAAVQEAAKAAGNGLTVLPGMEITSAEEAHVLGVFPDLEAAEGAAAELRTLLPQADPDYYAFFGEQPLLAATGHASGRRDGRAGGRLAPGPHLHRGVHPPAGRPGHRRPRRPQGLQRLLAAGVLPQRRRVRRRGSVAPRAGRFPRLAEYSALGLPLVGLLRQPLLGRDRHGGHRAPPGRAPFLRARPGFRRRARAGAWPVHDLSLYLLELLENSIRAGATQVEITLLMDDEADELRLTVDDDGRGLEVAPEQILDPFYTTKAGQEDRLGTQPAQGRRPGGRRRPAPGSVADLGRRAGGHPHGPSPCRPGARWATWAAPSP